MNSKMADSSLFGFNFKMADFVKKFLLLNNFQKEKGYAINLDTTLEPLGLFK
jgi:hypothetical protein